MTLHSTAGLVFVLSAIVPPSLVAQWVEVPSDSAVHTDCSLSARPRLLRMPPVEYPVLLARYGIEGRAVVTFVVEPSGRVREASLRLSQVTNPQFEAPARTAFLNSQFAPGRIRDRAVPAEVRYLVIFARGNAVRRTRLNC